jgi:stage V sporulation protein R
MFSYAKRGNGGTYIEEVSDKDGWKIVRDDLAKQVAGGGIPIIKVYDVKWDGTLMLEHEHDGRDMLVSETEHTLSHIKTLWGKPVHLRAKLDSDIHVFTK